MPSPRESRRKLIRVCAVWTVLAVVASAAPAATPFTHIVLIDVSGSMRPYLDGDSPSTVRGWLDDGLLGDPELVRTGERLIIRGFNRQSEPVDFLPDDPLRFWPRGAGSVSPLPDAGALEGVARAVMPMLQATPFDTDLDQALRKARLDWDVLAGRASSIVWMLTDNWQDVGGVSTGIDAFYDSLASADITGLGLVPLVRSPGTVEGNLVLYGMLLAPQAGDPVIEEFEGRMATASRGAAGYGFLEESLKPIFARGSQLRPPVMEGLQFEPGAGCDAELAGSPGQLSFANLRLGRPLTGTLQFRLRSTTKQWRIRDAKVTPLTFSSFASTGGDLDFPESVQARVTPPVLEDVGPGELSAARFQVVFPDDGILVPALRSRGIRHFFPGSEVAAEGRAKLGIEIDLARGQLTLNDEQLNRLVTQVRMIDGIGRMVSADADQEPVTLQKTYPVSLQVRIDDAASWAGLIILLLLIVLAGGMGVWVLIPSSFVARFPSGDESTGKASILTSGVVKTQGGTVGKVVKAYDGSLWFHPIMRDSTVTQPRRLRLSETMRDAMVTPRKDELMKIQIGRTRNR